MFYGVIIRMFYFDNKEHFTAHIHIEYQDFNAVISIQNSDILAGHFPPNKLKLVMAWIEIHRDELMADWTLAVEGSLIFKIDGLK